MSLSKCARSPLEYTRRMYSISGKWSRDSSMRIALTTALMLVSWQECLTLTWPIDDSTESRRVTRAFGDFAASAVGDTITLHEGIDIPALNQVTPVETEVRCVIANKVWKFVGSRVTNGLRTGVLGPITWQERKSFNQWGGSGWTIDIDPPAYLPPDNIPTNNIMYMLDVLFVFNHNANEGYTIDNVDMNSGYSNGTVEFSGIHQPSALDDITVAYSFHYDMITEVDVLAGGSGSAGYPSVGYMHICNLHDHFTCYPSGYQLYSRWLEDKGLLPQSRHVTKIGHGDWFANVLDPRPDQDYASEPIHMHLDYFTEGNDPDGKSDNTYYNPLS